MIIRLARADDAPNIQRLYAPYVERTPYNFELEPPDVGEVRKRIERVNEKWCWLVCMDGENLAGYAYGSRHRSRPAYDWSCETSVYIDQQHQRKGVATALYTTLLKVLSMQGFYNAYAVITLPNDPSVRFHESLGFIYFGTYHKVGYKLGKWRSVGWWRVELQAEWRPPGPTKKVTELQSTGVWKEVIAKAFPDSSGDRG